MLFVLVPVAICLVRRKNKRHTKVVGMSKKTGGKERFKQVKSSNTTTTVVSDISVLEDSVSQPTIVDAVKENNVKLNELKQG